MILKWLTVTEYNLFCMILSDKICSFLYFFFTCVRFLFCFFFLTDGLSGINLFIVLLIYGKASCWDAIKCVQHIRYKLLLTVPWRNVECCCRYCRRMSMCVNVCVHVCGGYAPFSITAQAACTCCCPSISSKSRITKSDIQLRYANLCSLFIYLFEPHHSFA